MTHSDPLVAAVPAVSLCPSQTSSTMDDPFGVVGMKLDDKYRVDAVMASGGFSVVYRATHLFWKRPVAIKAFRGPSDMSAARRAQLLEAFVLEGALLAQLAEASLAVCQARDIGSMTTSSGERVPFLVLEWLEGETLEVELGAERASGAPPRSLAAAMRLLSPVAAALGVAHDKGICHLDLKPGNLVVREGADGSSGVKLIDFGGAKVLAHSRSDVQASTFGPQLRSFTPAYGAPEQFDPRLGPTGPWTDVFALALIVVELVTGCEPLPGPTPSEMAQAAVDPGLRPTPRRYGAIVSDDVERVLLRALTVDPMKRFATAADFWRALELAMSDGPVEPLPLLQLQAASTEGDHGDAGSAARPSRRRRARAVWMAAAIAVLATATLEASTVAKRLGMHISPGASSMARDIAGFVKLR